MAVTTWSVVNDDTTESGPHRSYFRYAVFALAAVLVLSLGFVLIPREPDAPAPAPFSEQARSGALADAAHLRGLAVAARDAAEAARDEATRAALQHAVTLLTMQERALLLPPETLPAETVPEAKEPSGSAAASAGQLPGASAQPLSVPPAAELANALNASGARRLADAEEADGGMARLLAGTGVAQVLAAEEMAAATGTALAPLPGTILPGSSSPSAAGSAAGSPATSCTATRTPGSTDLPSSLTTVAGAELELIYAYQVALTRLPAASRARAADFLTQHEDLSHDAREAAAALCTILPPTPAGYALDAAFLADPATALGPLEASTLPAYGDLIALSAGTGRGWAVAGLQSAARRASYWGASTGPVAGVDLDESALPELPAADQPSAGSTPSRGKP
jgi:hypothetical protein